MSKRRAETTNASCKASTRTGLVYLATQLGKLQDCDFVVETNEQDFFRWQVHFPEAVLPETLKTDLRAWAVQTRNPPIISVEVLFPSDYPASVPFARVIRPRFQFHTGHVTVGGSLCTELLTTQGWMPMTPLALFHSICVMWTDGEGRLDLQNNRDYNEAEAKQAFARVAATHNWRV